MALKEQDLILVIEECAEVIQTATKTLRFGEDDVHPASHNGKPNGWALTEEIGQLLHCINRLHLDEKHIHAANIRKWEKLRVFGPEGNYLSEKPNKEHEKSNKEQSW